MDANTELQMNNSQGIALSSTSSKFLTKLRSLEDKTRIFGYSLTPFWRILSQTKSLQRVLKSGMFTFKCNFSLSTFLMVL